MNKKQIDALTEILKESGSSQSEIEAIIKLKKEDAKDKKWENFRSWTALLVSIFVAIFSFTNLNVGSTTNDYTLTSSINTNVSQHPTQDEWLKVYISHNIHELTDLWLLRVAANVAIISLDEDQKPITPKQLVVTIVSANGETAISGSVADQYKQQVETRVKSILEKYGVESEYELAIQTL